MEQIQERLKNPVVAAVLSFMLGLLIGWLVIGYWLWPVEWTDASPADLRADAQVDYLRMAIDSYSLNMDAQEARSRWQALGTDAPNALTQVTDKPQPFLESFKIAVAADQPVTPAEGGGTNNSLLYFGLCLLVLVLAAGVGGLIYMRRDHGGARQPSQSAAAQAARASQAAERTDYQALGAAPPIGQYMTTYILGDDLFDDSFSIESPAGEFLGECGVGIAETVGVGDPKKVSAYEVWLFDKNDIQTVTKVLMSEYAFNDTGTRERLAAKGEPVLAEANGSFVLDTATLQMVVRIVDMEFGQGPVPGNSFLSRLTLELAVWPRQEEEA